MITFFQNASTIFLGVLSLVSLLALIGVFLSIFFGVINEVLNDSKD